MEFLSLNVRHKARHVLEKSRSLRKGIAMREIAKERRFVRNQAKILNLSRYTAARLEAVMPKKSDHSTFFILGSGTSVNRLTDEQFRKIGRSRSVGINYWSAHPFLPDFYALESAPQVGDGDDLVRSLALLLRPKQLQAKRPVLILRTDNSRARGAIAQFCARSKAAVFFYGRISPATRKFSNLVGDLSWMHKMLGRRSESVVVDSGATVVRMIGIAKSLGAEKIVLVGVELDNTRYFWEEMMLDLPAECMPINNQKSWTHETNQTISRPFAVEDMILGLDRALQPDGVRLYVAREEGSLFGRLPLYDWQS